MRYIAKTITLSLLIAMSGCKPETSTQVTIGIIEPLQHKAMDEIVAGFTETLHQQYSQPVIIRVENAQNDANLKRAIIEKMHDAQYTLIVPIGVDATQMTLAMVHDQPVVSLASDTSDKDRQKLNPCNVAVVQDEISSKQLLAVVHAAYPQLTRLTLIHSSANKVFPEVQATMAAGKEYGIIINTKMVSSLPELQSATQAIPADTQGIFILKDHLIVSGIATLAKVAADHHIPLITSDEGSVQEGAGFAIGVREREIGVEGAKLAAAVLTGKPICQLPIATMKNLSVFINKNALLRESQNVDKIVAAAKQFNYKTEMVSVGSDG